MSERPTLNRATSAVLSRSAIDSSMADQRMSVNRGDPSAGTYKQGDVSLTLISEQPTVLRVFHMSEEKLYTEADAKEVTSPASLKSFKAIRATSQTPARVVTNAVGKKLFVPDVSLFKLYSISKTGQLDLLRDDDRPVVRMKNEDGLKFALLHTPPTKVVQKKAAKKKGTGSWIPEPGGLQHRRLMNDGYSKYSDLVLIVEGSTIHWFQAIMELRFPNLMQCEDLIKKTKEKKTAHGKNITVELHPTKVDLVTMQFVLDFALTGQLDFESLSERNLMKIMQLSHRLGMEDLSIGCECQLKNSLGLHNIFPFLNQTWELELEDLKEFGMQFCLRNWSTVAGNKEGLSIIGLERFQELTLANARNTGPPEEDPEPLPMPENTVKDAFRRLRVDMNFSDAVAVFGPMIIPFHRWILVAASPKFEEKFNNTQQKSSKMVPQFDFAPLSASAFNGLLDLLYFGESEMSVLDCCDLLEHVVLPYELVSVREFCEKRIADPANLSNENVLRVLAVTYLPMSQGNLTLTMKLRNACLTNVIASFAEVDLKTIDGMPPQASTDLLHLLHSKFIEHEILGLA